MTIPIKFRGKRVNNGEFIYGNLAHVHPEFYVGGREVDPDSVAQLVGYDCDGREVYEGDIIVVPCGTEYAARFFDNITTNAKLKENTP